jgi:hypothetical protein
MGKLPINKGRHWGDMRDIQGYLFKKLQEIVSNSSKSLR